MRPILDVLAQKADTASEMNPQGTIKALLLAKEMGEFVEMATEDTATALKPPSPQKRRGGAPPSRVKQLLANFERRSTAGSRPPQNWPERCKCAITPS